MKATELRTKDVAGLQQELSARVQTVIKEKQVAAK